MRQNHVRPQLGSWMPSLELPAYWFGIIIHSRLCLKYQHMLPYSSGGRSVLSFIEPLIGCVTKWWSIRSVVCLNFRRRFRSPPKSAICLILMENVWLFKIDRLCGTLRLNRISEYKAALSKFEPTTAWVSSTAFFSNERYTEVQTRLMADIYQGDKDSASRNLGRTQICHPGRAQISRSESHLAWASRWFRCCISCLERNVSWKKGC